MDTRIVWIGGLALAAVAAAAGIALASKPISGWDAVGVTIVDEGPHP